MQEKSASSKKALSADSQALFQMPLLSWKNWRLRLINTKASLSSSLASSWPNNGDQVRSSVHLDKMLRHLEASILVCDKENIIELDGMGNVLEIESVRGIGSGGLFAECIIIEIYHIGAAEALLDIEGLSAEDIGRRAMKIASDKCVMTNHNYVTKLL